MSCFDVYRILFGAINSYMDAILIKEDPTDAERKEYEELKYWIDSAKPNDMVIEIFKKLNFATQEQKNGQEK